MYSSASKSENTIDTFYGYNHNLRAANGEFYDMKNLTSSYYPMLSTRHKRISMLSISDDLQCLMSKDKLIYIANESVMCNGEVVDGLSFGDIDEERKAVSIGAYVLIFPDKVYFNTNDLTDCGDIGATFSTTAGNTVTFTLCDIDGNDYSDYTSSATEPESPVDGDLWLDTENNSLKQYSEYSAAWVGITTTYVKIAYTGIGADFSQYDGVKISGVTDEQFNTTMILWAVDDDYIVVTALIDDTTTQTAAITVSREIPDMEYFCEGENRVWGCNSTNNEIYACKLGDFKNWNCFMGLSTDSYAVSVGSDGDFTGAIRYQSSILFFKEACVHKIYNTNPPFQVSTSAMKGVQNGSWRSLCIVDDVLFFLSPTGVCTYEGAITSPINSMSTSTECYNSGVGGSFNNKYYLCVTNTKTVYSGTYDVEIGGLTFTIPIYNTTSNKSLFVYDTAKGIWHKEDNLNVIEFANIENNLCYIEEVTLDDETTRRFGIIDSENIYGDTIRGMIVALTYVLIVIGGDESSIMEHYFDWSAETGLFGLGYTGYKYISAVSVRLKLTETGVDEHPAYVKLYAEYDSSGNWELLDKIEAQETHGYKLRARIPVRCDHMRLKLEGVGECKIFSITLETEEGSNL